MLSSDKDHKLLSQLDFQKKQNLNVKMIAVLKSAGGAAGGSGTSALSAAANASGEVSVCCFVGCCQIIEKLSCHTALIQILTN